METSLPFLREPPFQLTPFLNNFFMTPLFAEIKKMQTPSPPLTQPPVSVDPELQVKRKPGEEKKDYWKAFTDNVTQNFRAIITNCLSMVK